MNKLSIVLAGAAVGSFMSLPTIAKASCENFNSCFKAAKFQVAQTKISQFKSYAANFPRRIRSTGERIFFFSPRHHRWAAYDESGRRVGQGIANGGATWCADVGRPCRTPQGTFRVRSKGSYDCKSGKYPLPNGGAAMPYCMHFKGGYAIHGSPHISNRNASHGCIRVTTASAAWLSENFINRGTKVVVLGY